MAHFQRNWKFSVADTDQIKQLCANRMTDSQIVTFFKRMRKRDITVEEVRSICWELGMPVKIDQRKGV